MTASIDIQSAAPRASMSFRGRLAIALVTLVLVAQAVSWLAVNQTLDENAWREANERLSAGRLVVEKQLQQRSQQLEQSARLLAADFGFRGAVATGDRATIGSMAVNHGARIGSDRFWILDLEGQVSFSMAGGDDELGRDFAKLLQDADANGATSRFTTIDGAPLQVVLVPVMAPQLSGWAVLGFTLDEALARQLRELTGLDVSIVPVGGSDVGSSASSSLPLTCFAALLDQGMPDPSRGIIRHSLDEHQFLTLRNDLAEVALLLHLDRDGVLENVYQLRAELAVIAALTLAGSLFIALLMTRTVTRPLQQLVAAAKRIGRGDYSQPVPVERDDEVGSLALTLEQMRSGIAERERTIAHQAFHDALTGLPNRSKAQQELRRHLQHASEAGHSLALLLVDLDRFKEINDSLGHEVGDQVLIQTAKRLGERFDEENQVARFGGDEFLLMLPRTRIRQAQQAADELVSMLAEPLAAADMQMLLDVSIGIAIYPEHGKDPAALLARADIALYDAKSQHRRWSCYEPGRDAGQRDKLTLANDLRGALGRNELLLHFQPKLDLHRGAVSHAEALLRWEHPTRGFISPDLFIPLAEQTGRIRELTRWVLVTAVRQIAQWQEGGHHVGAAVNLSALDLMDDGLPELVQQLLSQHQIDPPLLVLEVTESAVMRDADYGMAMLHRLRSLGVKLAIDDYGTGYSSLSYLKQLPVHEIKIDKSFVMNLTSDSDDAVIVRSTVELGHNMGLKVVAEGVENDAALELLRRFGCDYAQGYWISRPLPAAAMTQWLQEQQPKPEAVHA